MTQTPSSSRPEPSLTRRALVGTAAWSVPTLTFVAPVAAFATSVGGALRVDGMFAGGADYSVAGTPTTLRAGVSVHYDGSTTAPTLTEITVTVLIPDTRVSGGPATIEQGAGWVAVSPVHSGDTWVYAFTYTTSVAPTGSATNLAYRVPLSGTASGMVTLATTATATHATAGSNTVTAWV